MKKSAYRKNTIILNLKEDLGLKHDISVEFWSDPSQAVVFDLLDIVGRAYVTTDDDNAKSQDAIDKLNQMNRRYFECVSLVIADADVEGLDFSTPEAAEESFYDERISWGAFHQGVVAYLNYLMDHYELLKKALARVKDRSNSGAGKEQPKV